MKRAVLAVVAVLAATAASPTSAPAQSAVQWTRNRDATLVSKDVGPERWAITRRLFDGRVSGNVFRADGGAASFLDCAETGNDGVTVTLDCYGAGPAPGGYELIAAGLPIPLEFFFPRGEVVRPARLQDLVGSWRVEVATPGLPRPGIWEFDLATVVGNELRGFNQFGDIATVTVIAPATSTRSFRLVQPLIGVCGWFEFDLIGQDRIEGETWGTLKDAAGRCTATRGAGATGATKTIVGFRTR